MPNIVFENKLCRLTVGDDAIVKSLILKATGEECLDTGENLAIFSVTQERPYHNEVKLTHLNKRTTFEANSLSLDGDVLTVKFETVPVKAAVRVKITDLYIAFELMGFPVTDADYDYRTFTPPPVCEFRLIQLPVKNRKFFGEWLNVSHDDSCAVAVIGTSPYARIESECRRGYRIMTADATEEIKLRGCSAALICSGGKDDFMDAVASVENDYGLPEGVKSRRDFSVINSSIFWTDDINPDNVDEYIRYAKMGGFNLMLIYYQAMFREDTYTYLIGNFDYNDAYPNGRDDVVKVTKKLKAAGITPGFHYLQTHIGLKSRYVTPVVDHRLNLKKKFTLSGPLGLCDDVIYVEQNPENSVMHPKCRYLNFGGELINYTSYTTEPPYAFLGCTRGAYETNIIEHPIGQIGGILDITEYGAMSCYIDQNSSLQDEIAEKLADVYNAGFEFLYLDGSEGTNAPYGFHVPNAQYRCWQKLDKKPLFLEGAAKAHFSWHLLSGGNAFDIFEPPVFKEMMKKWPLEEVGHMREDFTRINFGWWSCYLPSDKHHGSQPDMYEYGTSHAAAYDCPMTIQINLDRLKKHPRIDDLFEVLRRWEDVKRNGWLTPERKEMLKDPDAEHILLINEKREYELAAVSEIKCSDDRLGAFGFLRGDESYVVFWDKLGEGKLDLSSLSRDDISYAKELYDEFVTVDPKNIVVGKRSYIKSKLPMSLLIRGFEEAEIK